MARFDGRQSLRFATPSVQQRRVIVRGCYEESDSTSDEGNESDKVEGKRDRKTIITPEYWYIAKIMKFLKIGHPYACLAALGCISGCNLENLNNLKAVTQENGLEMLVNLTEVNHPDCIIAALSVLTKITHDSQVCREVIDLGICSCLMKCITKKHYTICSLACQIIANVCRFRLAARNVRKSGGIKVIVGLLTTKKNIFVVKENSLTEGEKMEVELNHCAALALWSLCKFTKCKQEVLASGVIPAMSQHILSGNVKVALPMTGVLCECSSEIYFQIAIETEGLIGVLIQDMQSINNGFSYLCASALANAADRREMVNHLIRIQGGVDLAIKLLQESDRRDIPFISALLKLIWKSAMVLENVRRYETLKASFTLIDFINSHETSWKIPATGAVAELAKSDTCRSRLLSLNIISSLVSNFRATDIELLTNTAHAVGTLVSRNSTAMQSLEENDGVRRLWSLTTHKSQAVQVQAMNSLVAVVEMAADPGELVRSLNSSLHLLVKALRGEQEELIPPACRLIALVAKDKENLTVMTQHGLVRELSNLMMKEGNLSPEENEMPIGKGIQEVLSHCSNHILNLKADPYGIRGALATAIRASSVSPENAQAFGLSGVISVLVVFLQTKDVELQAQACGALWELSKLELNCIQIHLCGAIPFLLEIIGHGDQLSQIAAAGTLANVRRNLLVNDVRKFCKVPPLEKDRNSS